MFKYIQLNDAINNSRTIYIDMILSDGDVESIASDIFLNEPISIQDKYRLSTSDSNAWYDFVDSVASVVRSYDFEIVQEYQSKKSYSYYIHFYPVSNDGARFKDDIKIIFRLSDHRTKSPKFEHPQVVKKAMFRSFAINGDDYNTPYDVFVAVDKICKGLQKGDYRVLYQF